jgi:hypothetical protein
MRTSFIVFFFIVVSNAFGLTGRVTDNNGQPLPGATLTFVNNLNKGSVSVTTGQDGRYSVSLVQSSGSVSDVSIAIDQSAQKVIISFEVLNTTPLEMTLFDISGQALATIFSGQYDKGSYHLTWD